MWEGSPARSSFFRRCETQRSTTLVYTSRVPAQIVASSNERVKTWPGRWIRVARSANSLAVRSMRSCPRHTMCLRGSSTMSPALTTRSPGGVCGRLRGARTRRRESGESERLAKVIVGPGVKAAHAVLYLGSGSKHQDRHVYLGGAQPSYHLDPVQIWQHPVDYQEIELFGEPAREA